MELGSTYALSETGWAGPTGGETEDQAIGTVFYGIASPHNEMSIKVYTGLTDRAKNMEEFAIQALQFFLAFLEQC
jgi:nicotinamide mononucleotide (NMN) deamidase PncC